MNRYCARGGFCAVTTLVCCVFVLGLIAVSFTALAQDDARGKPLNTPADEAKVAPIAVVGDLAASEEIEDGYIMNAYRMAGREVMDVRELVRRAQGD